MPAIWLTAINCKKLTPNPSADGEQKNLHSESNEGFSYSPLEFIRQPTEARGDLSLTFYNTSLLQALVRSAWQYG